MNKLPNIPTYTYNIHDIPSIFAVNNFLCKTDDDFDELIQGISTEWKKASNDEAKRTTIHKMAHLLKCNRTLLPVSSQRPSIEQLKAALGSWWLQADTLTAKQLALDRHYPLIPTLQTHLPRPLLYKIFSYCSVFTLDNISLLSCQARGQVRDARLFFLNSKIKRVDRLFQSLAQFGEFLRESGQKVRVIKLHRIKHGDSVDDTLNHVSFEILEVLKIKPSFGGSDSLCALICKLKQIKQLTLRLYGKFPNVASLSLPLQSLHLRIVDQHSLSSLENITSLQSLNLEVRFQPIKEEWIWSLTALAKLKKFSLSVELHSPSKDWVSALTALTCLRHLRIDDYKIPAEAMEPIARMPLKTLSLCIGEASDSGITTSLSEMSSLQALSIDFLRFTALPQAPLKMLSISHVTFYSELECQLGQCSTLKSLVLLNCQWTHSKTLNFLEKLDLQELNLEGCYIFEDIHLSKLSHMSSLRVLNLSRTRVCDKGLAYLETLPLERLHLGSNGQITGEGLHSLNKMPNLRYLYLLGCGALTDKDMGLLSGLKLKKLDISHCYKITAEGVESLLKSTTLKELSSSLDVDQATRQRLPKCRFYQFHQLFPKLKLRWKKFDE